NNGIISIRFYLIDGPKNIEKGGGILRILFCSVVITFFSLGLLISSALAEDVETYEVGTSHLNVRSSPSHSAPIIGELQKGDQIRGFEENAFGWVKTYFGGEEAWVASQYLSKQSN